MYEYIIDADKSFLGAWFLEDQSLCDDLIYHFEQSPNKYEGLIQNATETIIDKSEKDSIDIDLPVNSPIGSRYVDELQKVLQRYIIKYPASDLVDKYSIEAMNIQKYNPNGGYKAWHTERSGGFKPGGLRHLVFMTYLNDVFDEGETEFLYQKYKVKPRKGLTVIWPADWTHTHRGVPSKTETKYIVTGWYAFNAQ